MKQKHGMARTKEYKTWLRIKRKCYDEKHIAYPKYGGRGVVFDYKDDFLGFLEEVGYSPDQTKEWSIDRINPNLGYVKGNMRWFPTRKQGQNKRMFSTNTSGVTGVYKSGKKWTAEWWKNAERFQQRFETFEEAVAHRKAMIEKMVQEGEFYTEHHGL